MIDPIGTKARLAALLKSRMDAEDILMRKVQPVTVGYTVTGSGSPSPNGDYVDAGYDNEGKDVYTFTDGSANVWSIWFHQNGWNFWIMNFESAVDVIPPSGGHFQATNGGAELIITGTYAGADGYSGTPTVGDGPLQYKKLIADDDATGWLTRPFSGIIHSPAGNTGNTTFRIDADDTKVVTLLKGSSFPVTRVLLNSIEVKTTTSTDYVLIYGGSWGYIL